MERSNLDKDFYRLNHGSQNSLNRSSDLNAELFVKTKSIHVTPPRDRQHSMILYNDSLLLRSNGSRMSNIEKDRECEIWKVKYDTLLASIKNDNHSLDAFKNLLKDRDRENSSLMEQNYKLVNEVAKSNS